LRSNNDMDTIDKSLKYRSAEYRRRRVNLIKKIIVTVAVILLVLPTTICVVLGIQVNRLQKQIEELSEDDEGYGPSGDADNETHVSAAEIPDQSDAGGDSSGKGDSSGNENPDTKENPAVTGKPSVTEKPAVTGVPSTEDPDSNTDKAGSSQDQTDKTTKEDQIYKGKKVYLTFDDGPSIYTDEILDILAKYQVKATFFVIGKTDEKSKARYKRIVEEGHTLGMHSYSHKYNKIYNSLEDFDKDFTKLRKLLYDTTGYKPMIYRFPGGSNNMVNKHGMDEFIRYLNKKSIAYYDWNVVNGDATGVEYTKQQLIKNVLDGVTTKNTSIVLMHDSAAKRATVDSLPKLLKELTEKGAEILPIDEEVKPIQMIKADSIK